MENHAKDNRFQDHCHRRLVSNQVTSSGDKDYTYSSKYKVSSFQRITAVSEVTENWIALLGKCVKSRCGAVLRESRVENEVFDHVLHEKRSKNIGQGRYQQDSRGQENERSEMDGSPREQQDGSSETTSPSHHTNAEGKKVTNMAEGNYSYRETSTGLLVVIDHLDSCAFEDNQESKASTYSQNTLKSVLDEVVKELRVPTSSRHRTTESKRRRNPEEKPSEEFLDAESELIENGVDGNNDSSPPSGSTEGRPMLSRALSFIWCSFFMSVMIRSENIEEEEEEEESLQAEVQTCSLQHGDLSGEKSHGTECLPQHFLARRCKDRRVLNTEKREVQVICSEREHTETQVNRFDAKDLADFTTQIMSCNFYEETATRVVLYKLKDAAEQRSDSKHMATQMDSDSKHMATQVDSDSKDITTQVDSDSKHIVTQVDSDSKDITTQADSDSKHMATQADSDSKHMATQADSDSKHMATQADSDSKHMATQVDSDSKDLATQVDSDSKHMATQVDSDSNDLATQADSDSKDIAIQVDSDSKHIATQVDSDSKDLATQVDSDSKHIATQVDSDSKHMATQADSDSKHMATQVDSDSKDIATQEDSDSKDIATQMVSDSKHIATQEDSDSKDIATQEDSDSKHIAIQEYSDSKHIATQVDSDSKLSATQVVGDSKGSSRESNSSDNRKQSAPLVTLSEAMRPVTEILPAEKKPSLLQQPSRSPTKGLLNARLDLSSSKKNDDNVDDTKEALMMYQRPATSSSVSPGLREWVVSMLRAPAEKVACKPPSKQRPSPDFQNEWQRLATFADFQAPSGIFLLPLASNGFFLLPASPAEPRDSSQRVQCAFCGVKVPVRRFLEEGGGSVKEVHQRASPGCRFISGQSRRENVAIADTVHSHELWPLDSQIAASSKNGLSLAPAVPQPRLSEALQTDSISVSANDNVENADHALSTATATAAAAAKDDTASATAAAADCSSSVATAGRFSATGSCDPKIGLTFNQNGTLSSSSATNQAPQFHLATSTSTSSSSKGPGISSSNSPSSSSSSVYQSSDANLTPLSSSSSGASTFAAATAGSRSSLVDPASADVAAFPRPMTTTMPTTTTTMMTTTTPIVAGVTTSPSQNSANLLVPSGSASVETGSTAITTTTTAAAATSADAASSAAARSGAGLSSPPSSSSSSSSSMSIPASNPSSGSSMSASEASFSSSLSSSSSHLEASENLSSAPDSASQTRSRESGERGGESAEGTASSENETERQVVTYEDLGIFATQPKRPDLAVTQIRINTFSRGWPHESTHPAFTMAEAGFYYTSHADLVRCFYCKGGLKTWESEDRPWVEHCRWFPRCPFVRLAKGQRFVDVVQQINTTHSQQTISEEQVMQEVTKRDREERAKAASLTPSQAATGGAEVTVDPYDEVLRKEGLRDGIDIAEKTWTEVVTRLEEEQDDIRNDTLCKMCQTEEVNVLFLPCGHLVACAQCAPALKNCAICRQPVKGSVRVQMTVEENADDSEEGSQ